MTIGFLFWLIMVIWFLFGLWQNYTPDQPYPFQRAAGNLLTFILFGLLGWQVFGPVIR